MASDALDKYKDETVIFTARHKIVIMLCFSISAALLFGVFLYSYHKVSHASDGQDDHEEDEDYWMDEEDILDDFEDY